MGEITSLSVQTKDKTRCNVYVDGKFCCGLSVETAMKHRLKPGMQVDAAFLEQIQLDGEKNAALSKALTFVTATQKTKKQVCDYLAKKGYLPVVIDYVISKMTDYHFLDDGAYAASYCNGAATKKGKRLIRMELRGKGVGDDEIEEALGSVDEETQKNAAERTMEKYMRGKTADRETLQKAFRYLLSKGFDYDLAREALRTVADIDED